MPLFEYVLLALLGSSGIVAPTTLGPELIVQPNGGAFTMAPQDPPKKDDSRHHRNTRRHPRHRRNKVYAKDKKGSNTTE